MANNELKLTGESHIGDDVEHQPLLVFDYRRIMNLLRREAIWIISIIASAVLLGVLLTSITTPIYTAKASVLVERQADQIIEGSDLTPAVGYQDEDRFLQTQVDVLNSRTLAARVVEAEKLSTDGDFFAAVGSSLPDSSDLQEDMKSDKDIGAISTELAIQKLQKNLNITLPLESRVISIEFKSADPIVSAKIANSVASRYIEGNLNRKFESSSYARDFLGQQLQEVRAKLEASERELNQYSRAAGLIRIAGQGANADKETTLSVTNDSLVQANSAASLATAERAAAEERWLAIANVPVLTMPQVLSNSAMQNLIKQKADIDAQLAAARAKYLDDYPAVLALKTQSERAEKQIQTLGAGIKRSVELEYQAALKKERALEGEVRTLKSSALAEQDRGVQYNILKRVAETNRSSYDTLLERYNQLTATAGASANNVSIVDVAEVPSKPSSPSFPKNIGISFMLGLLVATAFVVVKDHVDDTIRVPMDVESKLRIPMLGLIPRVEDGASTSPLERIQNDPKLPISEAYVSLVTNLLYSTADGLPRSIAITSSEASEGKSTTANAIAIDLARLGRKVLLIDADMRRPTLHRIKRQELKNGLSDVLSGNAALCDVLAEDPAEPGLSFILAGPRPPEASLLLGSARLALMIREAEELSDVVIVDCPPMLGLSDTASIAAHVRSMLLVIDSSKGHRGAVKSALRRLNLVGGKVIGAVLTKFDPKTSHSDYGYYGYSYYSYGHEDG